MDGVTRKLAKLKREARREWRQRLKKLRRETAWARSSDWRALATAALQASLRIACIVILPFAVLVRGAVFFHEHGRAPVWLALLVAALLTAAIVTAYAAWLSHKFTGRGR